MSMLDSICNIQENVKSKRLSSFDVSGGNADCTYIAPGATMEIANISGAGIIKHIWFTHTFNDVDPFIRRKLVIRMYWDGEDNPSVESPFGDFFGQGFGESYNYMSAPLAATPQEGRSVVCYFPMPYSNGARITLENQSETGLTYYYYIDYEEHQEIPDSMGRFHAWWNREFTPCESEYGENEWSSISDTQSINQDDVNNYLFADIEGKGQFVGVNYYVENPQPMWYGEGDDMWRIDGEDYPYSLHGTGTEDFFNCSWCPKEVYNHPYFGYPKVPWQGYEWIGRTHCYRFLIEDPIHFSKSLKATVEHGHANCMSIDISSVAYWYQTEPHKPYPEMQLAAERITRPEITARDITRWRDSWKREMKHLGMGDKLWGNEPFPEHREKDKS